MELELLASLELESRPDFEEFRRRFWPDSSVFTADYYLPAYVFRSLGSRVRRQTGLDFELDIARVPALFLAKPEAPSKSQLRKRLGACLAPTKSPRGSGEPGGFEAWPFWSRCAALETADLPSRRLVLTGFQNARRLGQKRAHAAGSARYRAPEILASGLTRLFRLGLPRRHLEFGPRAV